MTNVNFDNTTVNQEPPLKLQSIRKIKTCRIACKKTFNDPRIRRSTAVLYKKSTAVHRYQYRYQVSRVPVTVLKKYLGTVPCIKVPRYCPLLSKCNNFATGTKKITISYHLRFKKPASETIIIVRRIMKEPHKKL